MADVENYILREEKNVAVSVILRSFPTKMTTSTMSTMEASICRLTPLREKLFLILTSIIIKFI